MSDKDKPMPDYPESIQVTVWKDRAPYFEHHGPVWRVTDHGVEGVERSLWYSEAHVKAATVPRDLVDALIAITQDERFYRGPNWFDKIDEAIAAIQKGDRDE